MRLILFPAAMLMLSLCGCDDHGPALFKKLSPGRTGIHFNNTITENDSVNILSYYYCYNGGGVGAADFNNDGLQDVFFTGNMVSSKLYLNKGGMQFEDITEKAGVTTKDWIMGVSVVDINHDGFMDIYLNVAGPELGAKHHNLLFINQKNLTFREEAAAYGLNDSAYCVQSAFLDYDRDGDLDMYLLTNDVDNVEKTFIQPATYPITRGRTADKLYENVGDTLGHPYYRDVSAAAGIAQEGYGLGLAVDDLNGDGWPDIYAANDFMPNDQLLINQRNKTFREAAHESMPHQTYNGMGVDIADINNDARPDIMVMDMLPETYERRKTMIAKADYEKHFLRQRAGYVDEFMRNTLQLNQGTDRAGTTHFSDIAQLTGMHATDWSWGVLLADYDNDGLRDAYITNGFVKNITNLDFLAYNTDANMFGTDAVRANRTKDLLAVLKGVKLSNYMYRNSGNLAFENITRNWGLEHNSYSNGAAYADLDNDGDLDLVVNNINEEAFVFENTSHAAKMRNNHLQVILKGNGRNPNGIGAAVTTYCGKKQIYNYCSPVKGYLSSMSGPLHIGLGQCGTVDSLIIRWPDGKTQTLKNVKPNQKLVLDYAKAITGPPQAPRLVEALFQSANKARNIRWKHAENDFNDFIDEPLLLNMYSRKGPGIAVGDADGRNGSDFFLGGAAGYPGTLFSQTSKGTFEPQSINAEDNRFEDTGALFLDADGDGDQDLYVVSGGSDFKQDSTGYADRLYFNDGKGHFKKQAEALPLTTSSGSCVVAADFDRDGDLDIFRAGAVVPGNFPASPKSYLFRNDGGRFTDVTKEIAPGLASAGMINAATWSDFDKDGWPDLILTGEWIPPVFFQNGNGKLVNITSSTGLQNMNGWWSSIYPADLDSDGDTDYILGNMGDNVDYRPSKTQPLELYHGDFVGNGRQKPLATQYVLDESGEKKAYPMAYRDDLFRSMPVLKKRFNTYEPFSRAKMGDLFESKLISNARHLTTETFRSCILENKGNGRFAVRDLPVEAQFSCVYGILVTDADGDGHADILLTGNSFSNEVVFGSMDASLGLLLKGDGKLHFSALPANRSGLFLTGATRGLGMLYDAQNHPLVIAPTNSGDLRMLNPQRQPTRIIRALPNEVYAEITFQNGSIARKEFQYGAGYLSQQENVVEMGDGIREVRLFDIHQKSTRLIRNDALLTINGK
ncbi:Repeat domain-containing protein [Dyadobacter sp. SG02]|uniref:VCBS repeat-containing protein n=1 Tax=Dyadobacter sp. SG02 TaxID=1855291 RepID=UPI0008CA73C3|nr:VCBS repeat-containing protein [Dyadobacter sp. SG02]SEI59321.1 Repeat domain-containing protein [Dyadobacter sp. SG02]